MTGVQTCALPIYVTGIDGSLTAINKGKERLEIENLNANLVVGDIIDLPFDDQVFDGVIDVECLYSNNSVNTERILKGIKRVLKPGGLFYSRTFSEKMVTGQNPEKISLYEYKSVTEGPQAGHGFMRLINRGGIYNLYGKYFNIISLDKLEYSTNNEKILISEWIIICGKNE